MPFTDVRKVVRTLVATVCGAAVGLFPVAGPAVAEPTSAPVTITSHGGPRSTPGSGCGLSVESWLARHSHRLTSLDPRSSPRDLRWLSRAARGAKVVGLGEATHGSREQFRIKHRMVRALIEQRGFRTLAFEDDFASGVRIDRYITTGEGDPEELVSAMSSPFWNTEEIVALLEWLRTWNRRHPDPEDTVRFLGTDLLQLRESSFDAITEYVGSHAPHRLDELATHLDQLRPRPDQFSWYEDLSADEKQTYIDHARRVSRIVDRVNGTQRWQRAIAEQHARAIHGWYVNYAEHGFRDDRERFIADSIRWWRQLTGHKTVYWAANVHTAAAPSLTYRTPDEEQSGTMAGGHLERRLDDRYLSIGTWFGAGSISSAFWDPGPHRIGPPGGDMLEATLQCTRPGDYAVDLRRPAPPHIDAWLDSPRTMRVILPTYTEDQDGNDYSMTVPELTDAFDVVVFVPVTTASRLLPGNL